MRPGGNASDDDDDDRDTLLTPFLRYKRFVDSTLTSALDKMFGSNQPDPPKLSGQEVSREALHPNDILGQLGPEYHPSQLRHLPQPVPNYLRPGMDGSVFRFEDAYLDLMMQATSRSPYGLDLRALSLQRNILNKFWPDGEPPSAFHHRLAINGIFGQEALMQALKNSTAELMGQATPGTLLPDLAKITDKADILRTAWGGIRQMMDEALENVDSREEQARRQAEFQKKSEQMLQEQMLQEHRENFPNPDVFDETVNWAKGAVASGARSWDTFKESLREETEAERKRRNDMVAARFKALNQREEGQRSDEIRDQTGLVVSAMRKRGEPTWHERRRDVRTDENGTVHITTTLIHKDQDGNVLSSASNYREVPRPGRKGEEQSKDCHQGTAEAARGTPAEPAEMRKKSWFWK